MVDKIYAFYRSIFLLYSNLLAHVPSNALWIRGDYVISDATLNRFFAFHVIALPLLLFALIYLHLAALHTTGSNNPDGIEIKQTKDTNGVPLDGIPFHPYYTVKDIFGLSVFLVIFTFVVFVIFFSNLRKSFFLIATQPSVSL